MDACPRCTKPLYEQREVCPHCGVMVSFYKGPELGPNAARKLSQKKPRGHIEIAGFPVIKITLALFCLGLIAWVLLPTRIDVADLRPARVNDSGFDPCLGKQRCVIAYVTPWCPVCKLTIPVMRGLIRRYANSTEVGIKPVVGGRSAKRMEEMAEQIGRTAFLDRSGRFWAGTGVKSVPHWFVLDGEGFLVKAVPGAYPTVQSMIEQLDLEDYR